MRAPVPSRSLPRLGLPIILFCLFLAAILVCGGASRSDALGQVASRLAAWSAIVVAVLFGERKGAGGVRAVAILLAAATVLVLVQLVPLSPGVSRALPGRDLLSVQLSTDAGPWRPLSIVPGETFNAVASLIVPATTLLLLAGLNRRERSWVPGVLLALVTVSALIGLLQFSGGGIRNPFANTSPGSVVGTFANRNHFAVFLAFGCLLAPVWAFADHREGRRLPVAFGMMLLFILLILATGSRAGMLVGSLASIAGMAIVWGDIRWIGGQYPRWMWMGLVAAVLLVLAAIIVLSVSADRAVSISRALDTDVRQDMRWRAFPIVMMMIGRYFPWGSGSGGFDPLFRLHEPLSLLKPTYFNHAHNDYIEVALDTGLPGILVLLAGVLWWARASIAAWQAGTGVSHAGPKLGSAMILLVLVASAFDYPVRTPIFMVTLVVAATLLSGGSMGKGEAALPPESRQL